MSGIAIDDLSSADYLLVEHYLQTTSDFNRERFRHHGDIINLWAIDQAECRRRCAKKLPRFLTRKEFVFPTPLSAEQSTSETLAEFHASLIGDGCSSLLDMTAGLGIDAMTVASVVGTNGGNVTAIERDETVAQALAHNARVMEVDTIIKVVNADSVEWIQSNQLGFDTIFIDPARRGKQGQRLYSLADCSPDVTALMPLLRGRAGRLIIKASPMLDPTAVVRSLPGITDLYSVGTPTECKELVAVVDLRNEGCESDVRFHAVTITNDGSRRIDSLDPSSQLDPSIASPEAASEWQWIAEPYPSVMKINVVGWLESVYGVERIAPSTHLFVGRGPAPSRFPGRIHRIIESTDYSRKGCSIIRGLTERADITPRNFPDTTDRIARRLKIKEGGPLRLFAVKDAAGSLRLILCDQN